jgi:cell division septation protein DedD
LEGRVIEVKKTIAIIVAATFVFAIASVSFAAGEKAEMAKPTEMPKVNHVIGKVKAVDTVAQTLTIAGKIKGKEKEAVVTVDKETRITMGKAKKTFADLKVGNNVVVKYTEVEGKNVAKIVAIMPIKKITEAEFNAEVKEEIKKEPPQPQPPSVKPSEVIFTVQAGAFRNESYAKAFETLLKEKGYSAYITLSESKEGEKLHKVYIGKFTEREEAKTLSEKIRNNEGIQTFVTSLQP